MFSKAAVLAAVALVLLGYRWGKRSAAPRTGAQPAPQPAAPAPAPQRKAASWLSVRVLLIIAIILLVIAIFSSLQR